MIKKLFFSGFFLLLVAQSSVAQLSISGTMMKHNDYFLRNVLKKHGENPFDQYSQFMFTADWKIKQWIVGASISRIKNTEKVQSSNGSVDCCSYDDHFRSANATVEYVGVRVSIDYDVPLDDHFSFLVGAFVHVDGVNDHDEWNHQTVHSWGSYTFDYHYVEIDNQPFVVLETRKNFVYSGVRASMRFSFFNCWIQPTVGLVFFGTPRLHNYFKEKYTEEYFGIGKGKGTVYFGNEFGISIGYSFKWNE